MFLRRIGHLVRILVLVSASVSPVSSDEERVSYIGLGDCSATVPDLHSYTLECPIGTIEPDTDFHLGYTHSTICTWDQAAINQCIKVPPIYPTARVESRYENFQRGVMSLCRGKRACSLVSLRNQIWGPTGVVYTKLSPPNCNGFTLIRIRYTCVGESTSTTTTEAAAATTSAEEQETASNGLSSTTSTAVATGPVERPTIPVWPFPRPTQRPSTPSGEVGSDGAVNRTVTSSSPQGDEGTRSAPAGGSVGFAEDTSMILAIGLGGGLGLLFFCTLIVVIIFYKRRADSTTVKPADHPAFPLTAPALPYNNATNESNYDKIFTNIEGSMTVRSDGALSNVYSVPDIERDRFTSQVSANGYSAVRGDSRSKQLRRPMVSTSFYHVRDRPAVYVGKSRKGRGKKPNFKNSYSNKLYSGGEMYDITPVQRPDDPRKQLYAIVSRPGANFKQSPTVVRDFSQSALAINSPAGWPVLEREFRPYRTMEEYDNPQMALKGHPFSAGGLRRQSSSAGDYYYSNPPVELSDEEDKQVVRVGHVVPSQATAPSRPSGPLKAANLRSHDKIMAANLLSHDKTGPYRHIRDFGAGGISAERLRGLEARDISKSTIFSNSIDGLDLSR